MRAQQAVLIIDDERNFCRILEAKLRKSDFTVATAGDAASGINHLLHQRFDLVLLDVRLPDANTLEILPHLRAAVPNTPFLLMTAYEEEGLRERALRAGAVNVLYKPFDLDFLVQSIRLHIAESRRAVDTRRHIVAQAGPTPTAVQLGQAVVLQVDSNGEADEVGGRVTGTGNDTFSVVPERALPTEVGRPVGIQFTGEDGVYSFESRVVAASEERGAGVSLAKPLLIRRHQRRKHPRVAMHVPVSLHIDSVEEAGDRPPDGPSSLVHGMAQDVSLGGLSLVATKPVAVGVPVRATWTVPLPEPAPGAAQARAVVARCTTIEGSDSLSLYYLAVRFVRLTGESRARLRLYLSAQSPD